MAIDEVPDDRKISVNPEGHSHTSAFVAIFIVLAILVIGEFYSLGKIGSLRTSLEAQDGQMHKTLTAQLTEQFSSKISALENSNAQQFEALKTQLDTASKRMRSTRGEVQRARATRAMVEKLQAEQQQEAEQLKQEIAQKADQQQVGALTQDVSATKTDLATTKKTVGVLTSDLGMARSELGTLIARNHDDIELLRKLGQRNYYEFALARNQQQKVAGVGLILKKTNLKHHRFNLNLLTDDMVVEKNNRTVNEPIFFVTGGSKGFYELVANKVENDKVTGYMSTPKYSAVESAQQTGGTGTK